MHSTNKSEKSGAERFGVSGPDPESPESPETPRKSSDTPGFSTAEKEQLSHRFSI
jgi:hypothetical protein